MESQVVTADINHFWEAYDLILLETDTAKCIAILDSLYIKRGSVGLEKMMEVRNYSAPEYVSLIKQYPKYWNSIRLNTLRSKEMAEALNTGIKKFNAIYPDMRSAKIYFTIGGMRSNGTTKDDKVLIGSELAMADSSTDISEFEGRTKSWLNGYFSTNPIDGLILLNVHEYVHTQQKEMPKQLLYLVLYEGIAEFVATTAMQLPSNAPAIAFGESHPAVREKFEREVFEERIQDWLWSNSPNEFGVRDLGYYIGYAIAKKHYEQATDKKAAIKELIELDYSKRKVVNALIDQTGYFSKPIKELK